MRLAGRGLSGSGRDGNGEVLVTHKASASDCSGLWDLITWIKREPMALIAVFVSPDADFRAVIREFSDLLPSIPIIGCTTAGEISASGYDEGCIVAVGFPSRLFATKILFIEDLHDIDAQELIDRIIQERLILTEHSRNMNESFAFLLIDGLSLREDVLAAAISPALAEMQLFGGSAGDGVRFQRTLVAGNGRVRENAAVLALVRTACKVQVFTLNHLLPQETRMVVTDADPDRRIVKTINAEPAAREYARIVGKDPDQLDPFTFAAHPVVVRIGGEHHVRSIQRVNERGELVFLSAIDEGMVLKTAVATNMADHLERFLSSLPNRSAPHAILACDCILRRIEALRCQSIHQVSNTLARHRVTGFCTYGEQIGPLHVNQTMTGVALYAPEEDL